MTTGGPRLICLTLAALLMTLGLMTAGCVWTPHRAPSRTHVQARTTVLPARIISHFFIVESRWKDGNTYRFLIDTGSTATLVSSNIAKHFSIKSKQDGPPRTVKVHSASGGAVDLEAVTLRRVSLGDSSFDRVPALVFDFNELSDHLGIRIDGIIGFPVFRDALLTMDYPAGRLVIAPCPDGPVAPAVASPRTSIVPFNNQQSSPLISVQMSNESFVVLVDSGSDAGVSLNPTGLHPRFAHGPRAGLLTSSLQGDSRQLTGRLEQDIVIGGHTISQPIVDLTDQLSSIGGDLLRHFILTFDQHRNQVSFTSDTDGPIVMEPRRSTGISFARSPIYWRVLTVVPDTPTAELPVQAGDLCVRINGEPTEKWTFERYAALVKTAAKITFTFLAGTRENDVEVPVFELVP